MQEKKFKKYEKRMIDMKKKSFLRKLATTMVIAGMMVSSVPAFAEELPESINMDGRVFVMDKTAGGGSGTATPDNEINMERGAYKVTGSDVRLYIDYGHGHGGDHFAAGWVETTAPRFTARAEIWSNGRPVTIGKNTLNIGKVAKANSGLAVGIISNAKPRIFYAW